MRYLHCLPLLLALFACQPPQYIVVTLDDIPVSAQSIAVLADHANYSALEEPTPFKVPQPPATQATLLLYLPATFHGDVGLGFGAFDGPDGQGCLVATGSGRVNPFMAPADALRVTLKSLAQRDCTGKRPRLLAAQPPLTGSAGGQSVELLGWGFRPDSTAYIADMQVDSQFVSAIELSATAPPRPGCGPAVVRVTNKDGSFDERSDILRYYASKLTITEYSEIPSDPDVNDFSRIAYLDSILPSMAVTLPTKGLVRILVVDGSVVDVPAGMHPSGIVAADFDKDGQIDLIVTNMSDPAMLGKGAVSVLRNIGNGQFALATSTTVETPFPSEIVAADLNSDGYVDFVITDADDSGPSGGNRIVTVLNNGISLEQKDIYSPCHVPSAVALAELDGTPGVDMLFVCAKVNPMLEFVHGNNNGTFLWGRNNVKSFPLEMEAVSVALRDIDKNGQIDVLVSLVGAPGTGGSIRIFANPGELFSLPVTQIPSTIINYTVNTDPSPANIAFSDVNCDGFDDMMIPCAASNAVNIFLNKQGAGFENVKAIRKGMSQCISPSRIFAATSKDATGISGFGFMGHQCLGGLSIIPM